MQYRSDSGDRTALWAAAKLAVRRYSREPSDTTAADVRRNLKKIRDLPAPESGTIRALRRRWPSGRRSGARS